MIQMVFRMDDDLEGYMVRFYHVWDENTQTSGTQGPDTHSTPHGSITCLWRFGQQAQNGLRAAATVMLVLGSPPRNQEWKKRAGGPRKAASGLSPNN